MTVTVDDATLKRGRLWATLLLDSALIARRVETIEFQSAVLIERKISLDISATRLAELARLRPFQSHRLVIPLLFQPKGLIFDFDLRLGSEATSAPSRFRDSEVSSSILAAMGESITKKRPPSSAVDFLRDVCQAMLVTGSSAFEVAQSGLTSFMQASKTLTPAGRAWLVLAARDQDWLELSERLARDYLITVELDLRDARSQNQIVKIRRVESLSDSRISMFASEVSGPSKALTLRVWGAGRASSEHYRVIAPPGMFFDAGSLVPPGGAKSFTYDEQHTRDRLIFYTNSGLNADLVVVAVLLPSRRDFVTPARLLTFAVFLLLAIGAVSEFVNGELSKLAGAAGSLSAIALFTPSAVLTYLLKPDDHEMRWDSLRPWRIVAFLSLGPLLAGVVTLLPKSSDWAPGALRDIWVMLALISFGLSVFMFYLTKRISGAEKSVKRREGERFEFTLIAEEE